MIDQCDFCVGYWTWDETCVCGRRAPEGWELDLPDVCDGCDMPETNCCCG